MTIHVQMMWKFSGKTEHHVSPLLFQMLLVIGGQAPKAIRSVECYDFKDEKWSHVADMPSRRCRCGKDIHGWCHQHHVTQLCITEHFYSTFQFIRTVQSDIIISSWWQWVWFNILFHNLSSLLWCLLRVYHLLNCLLFVQVFVLSLEVCWERLYVCYLGEVPSKFSELWMNEYLLLNGCLSVLCFLFNLFHNLLRLLAAEVVNAINAIK